MSFYYLLTLEPKYTISFESFMILMTVGNHKTTTNNIRAIEQTFLLDLEE